MFGLQFIAVNFLYLLFSLIVGIVTYVILSKKEKFTRPKRFGISIGTFLVVWMLPFWDLLLQKAIKTYYETFMMESKIYAYPEKDKDGKIESLNVIGADSYGQIAIIDKNQFVYLIKKYKNIRNFVEIKIILDRNSSGHYIGDYGEKHIRIDLKNPNMSYTEIKGHDYKARYSVKATKFEPYFFGLYIKKDFTFNDEKTNTVMTTAWAIELPTDKENFRNKYLLFRGPSGVLLHVYGLNNVEHTSQDLFGFMTIEIY